MIAINSSNATALNGTQANPPYNEAYWIISESILTLITIFAVYLLACMTRYASMTRCKPGRELSAKKGKVLYRMCVLSVAMSVVRLIADHTVALVGWQTDQACIVSVAVSAVFYSLSLYPVYLFLWMRQSIFYANPVLSHVLNPAVTVISWATLVVMLFGGTILTILYVIPDVTGWQYVATDTGCKDIADESGFDLVPTLVVIYTVSFQLSLLALFMYPLLTKKTQRYRSAGSGGNSSSGNKDSSSTSQKAEEDGSESSKNQNNSSAENESRVNEIASADEFGSSTASQYDSTTPKQEAISEDSMVIKDENKRPSRPNRRRSLLKGPFYRRAPAKVQVLSAGVQIREKKTKNKKFRMSTASASSFSDIMKRNRKDTSEKGTRNQRSKRNKTQQGRKVIRFIRKAFILTLICVMSDVLFTVVQMVLVVPELVYLVLFDINLMVNIICIIMSFRDWPSMILPFWARYKEDKNRKNSDSKPSNNDCTRIARMQNNTFSPKTKITKINDSEGHNSNANSSVCEKGISLKQSNVPANGNAIQA